jgi:hypothetical protein
VPALDLGDGTLVQLNEWCRAILQGEAIANESPGGRSTLQRVKSLRPFPVVVLIIAKIDFATDYDGGSMTGDSPAQVVLQL